MNPQRIAIAAAVALALAACTTARPASTGLRLVAALEQSPAIVGQNAVTIQIKDGDGNPVKGAKVVAEPWMPSMNHGSPEDPATSEVGVGNYRAFPVTLIMPGAWVVRVKATAGAQVGNTELRITVPDPP